MRVETFKSCPATTGPLYMLLECDKQTLQRIYRLESEPEPYELFANTELAAHVEQGPWLMRLSPASEWLAAYSSAPQQWSGLLLSSMRPVQELLAHLRKMLVVPFDGQRKGVLRYYDPRVASYLFPATAEADAWLGPIEQLIWHGATWAESARGESHWQSLKAEHSGAAVPSLDTFALDRQQTEAFERQQLERFAYDWQQGQQSISFARAWHYLQQGLAAGFDETESLNAYLDVRARHPARDSHPPIAQGETHVRLQQLQAWLEATPAPMESQG